MLSDLALALERLVPLLALLLSMAALVLAGLALRYATGRQPKRRGPEGGYPAAYSRGADRESINDLVFASVERAMPGILRRVELRVDQVLGVRGSADARRGVQPDDTVVPTPSETASDSAARSGMGNAHGLNQDGGGGDASDDQQDGAPRPDDAFVRGYYREWSRTGAAAQVPPGLEVVPMRYSGQESAGDFERPIPLFKDAPQVAELVRFSLPGSETAWVFPHPEAAFHDTVLYYFPDLSRADYPTGPKPRLAEVEPVNIRRRPDGLWMRAQAPHAP